MARPRRIPAPPENHLLAALPPREYRRLAAHLEAVPLHLEQVLAQPGQPISHIYFPTGGIVSVVVATAEGACVEIGTIGKEGMVDLTVLFAERRGLVRAIVQSPGSALALPADQLRRQLAQCTALQSHLLRYAHSFLTMIMHAAACNHFHHVEQRLACLLLLTQDRLGTSEFLMTQRHMGQMLGVRRISVTPAARKMQEAGLIRYRRGRIAILNRPRLVAAACSCYPILARLRLDTLQLPKS